MSGKKGMSPLIATILLMAFAVALGAVIMNWSTSIPEGGPDCSEVRLNVNNFCTQNNELHINLRNVGTVDLSEITLSVVDAQIEIDALKIQDSRLNRGQTLNTRIRFGFSNEARVGVIPVLADGQVCAEPVYVEENIPTC